MTMDDEKQYDDVETLEVEAEDEAPEADHTEAETDSDDPDEGVDEDVITLAGEEEAEEAETPKNEAPEWVRELRRENKELKRKLYAQEAAKPAVQKIEVGPKPTLESCDYDDERLAEEIEAWALRKLEASKQEEQARRDEAERQSAWQAELARYEEAKSKLKLRDYKDAEEAAIDHLDEVQQAMIVKYADNPAAVIYALGKRPTKAEELGKVKDYAKFAFLIAKMEKDIKLSTRKAPAPERVARGAAPTSSASADKHLEKLEAEAARSGNRSKVIAYRKQLAAEGRA